MVEHGIAWRRRARQSVACHSMAWHCVRWSIASQSIATQNMASHNGTKHNTALHVMAWHQAPWRVSGSFSRGLGQSGVAAPCPAPWAPRKAPHEAGLMESTRWLGFQHGLLKAETGLPPDTSSKRRRPKVWGGLLRPKKSTNRHRMCNHFRCFFRGVVF